MGREHRIAFGARIETRRRRERAPFRAPGKVDDFDRAFATCPTKLTCALCTPFPLFFFPPSSSPIIVSRNERPTNLSKKNGHFFFSYLRGSSFKLQR